MFNFIKNLFSNDNAELKQIINDNAFLVDVRTDSEFNSGYVSSSINIPLDTIQSKIDKFKNKKHVVVFCQSGMRSRMAKSILERNGIKNVVNAGTWNKVNKLIKT